MKSLLRLAPLVLSLPLTTLSISAADRAQISITPPSTTPEAESLPVGAAEFWKSVALLDSGNREVFYEGRCQLRRAAELGYVPAQVHLANSLTYGINSFRRDPGRAIPLFRKAAQQGSGYASVSLGQAYYFGNGVAKDPAQATRWLQAALKADADYSRPTPPRGVTLPQPTRNNQEDTAGRIQSDWAASSRATANYLLADLLQPKDPAAAHVHFEAACSGPSGIYQAAIQAALNYALGRGVPRDMAKANANLNLSHKLGVKSRLAVMHNSVPLQIANDLASSELVETLEKAATNTEQYIQLRIAATLANKESKDYNIEEAVKWYELAAENDKPWAMLKLGFIHSRGDLGKPDPEKAFSWFEKAGGGDKPKHTLAVANYAICLARGLGTKQDTHRASELFRKYKQYSMICYLGSINLCPMKVTDYDQDLKLTRKWADSGNAHALYLLGIRQKEGWDEKPDSQRAYELFERAAKAGDADAQYEMGWLNEQHADYLQAQGHTAARVSEVRTLAREWYAKSAFLKNPFAIAKLGQIEFSGWFRPPNLEGAREYYDRGLSENPKHAGLHYLYGLLLKKQLEKAVSANDEASVATFRTQMLEHFKTSAEEGSPFACAQLGHLYLVGELVTQDYSTAYQHFTSATEKGLAWAHGPLGRMHEYGQGVPITPEEAAYHYRLAALAGNIDSALSLCRLYVGLGDLPCDSVRAMFWLDKLEKMGHPNPTFGVSGSAKEILAKALIRKGEYDTSVDFLNRLAKGPKEEQAIAYRNLSVLYANGWGVTKNTGTATSYRRKAIACGSNAAKCDQAIDLLQQGRNKEGLSLLDEASQAGEAEATYELALAYRRLGGATPSQITDLLIGAAKAGCVSAQLERAAQTISDVPGAPDVQEALRLVRAAAAEDNPEAIRLQVELLKRVPSREKTPEADSTRARSS